MTHAAEIIKGCSTLGSPDGTTADFQRVLNAYFHEQASYWATIYEREETKDVIHQERLRAALALADTLQLTPGSRVLDVGCGAGYATIAMANRQLTVDAVDPAEIMVQATTKRAARAGVQARVTAQMGDIHSLPFADNTFALVLALGVLPWLPRLDKPLREMARVIRPGGYLVISVDTQWQLRHTLDPLRTRLLHWPKRLTLRVLRRWRQRAPTARANVTSLRAFRRALAAEGFDQLRGVAIGFGPFTFFDRNILARSTNLKLNFWLQSLATRGVPILRSSGNQYLALARKRSGAACGTSSR